MKNMHALPTNKPSRLHFDEVLFISPNLQISKSINSDVKGRNIYITDDSEIKVGHWIINSSQEISMVLKVTKVNENIIVCGDLICWVDYSKKIILTTDQDLIEEGIQAIDDEFLEWFVKNPSCDEIKIDKKENLWFCCDFFEEGQEKYCINSMPICPKCNAALGGNPDWSDYKIIIPKPIQQIIDEDFDGGLTMGQIITQEEKMYNEEDVKNAFLDGWQLRDGDLPFPKAKKKWFNEFKNK